MTRVDMNGERSPRRVATRSSRRGEIRERHRPTQDRAKKTVDIILETAAVMLEEMSIDTFNTNVLAQRANVRVRSVYRYYPNKIAVIAALWERMVDEWDELLSHELEQMSDPRQDLELAYRSLLVRYINWLSTRRGASAIRRTMRAVPALQTLEREAEVWYVSRLSKALKKRDPRLKIARLKIMCTITFRAANAVINTDIAYDGKVHKTTIDELSLLINRYQEVDFRGAR